MKNYLESNYNLEDHNLVSVIDELPLWSAPFGLSLLDHVQLKKEINALDIGFGTGFPLLELAMRLGNSSKVFGIDPWQAAIDRTKQKITQIGISNIDIIKGVAEKIPLPDNCIDLLISNNGINNVTDLNKTLEECSRVAKSGAQFVLTVNLQETMIEFYNIYEEILIENMLEIYLPGIKNQIYKKRKPLNELKSLLSANGFEVNKVIEDKFQYHFVDGTSMFNHFLISLAFLDSWKNIIPRKYQEQIFEQIEARINNIALQQGVFSLNVPYVTINCRKT
ncbi:MAG: methyltransferase domain-containing protein [Bacteroidales bacterium]|nr:methyltransferase domain-containing protein [Bacteroidales bacterium]